MKTTSSPCRFLDLVVAEWFKHQKKKNMAQIPAQFSPIVGYHL